MGARHNGMKIRMLHVRVPNLLKISNDEDLFIFFGKYIYIYTRPPHMQLPYQVAVEEGGEAARN